LVLGYLHSLSKGKFKIGIVSHVFNQFKIGNGSKKCLRAYGDSHQGVELFQELGTMCKEDEEFVWDFNIRF
jgi:hypothetical protein